MHKWGDGWDGLVHVMSGPMVKMSRLKKIEMSDPEIADCVQKVGGGAPSSNTIRHYSFLCSWKLRGGWGEKNTRAGRRGRERRRKGVGGGRGGERGEERGREKNVQGSEWGLARGSFHAIVFPGFGERGSSATQSGTQERMRTKVFRRVAGQRSSQLSKNTQLQHQQWQ